MNLIFVKNLGFSIVCERFLSISLGRAKPDHVLLVYRKWGSAPSPRARCARRLLRCCFVCILIGICVQLHRWQLPPAPSQGLEGIMIRCIGIAYGAVMGTRQRFPEVRTAFGVYPTTFAKCLVGILRCSNGD